MLLARDERCTAAAATLVEQLQRRQRTSGRFATGDGLRTMLHPHLYAAEGLWMWAQAAEDAVAAAASAAAVDWVWRWQLDTGGFPRWVDSGGARGPEQSDVTAQALRLGRVTGRHGADAEAAARRLRQSSVADATGLAVPYVPHGRPVHLNTWCTLFTAQALDDRRALAWSALV
jgi:hypothetical protein